MLRCLSGGSPFGYLSQICISYCGVEEIVGPGEQFSNGLLSLGWRWWGHHLVSTTPGPRPLSGLSGVERSHGARPPVVLPVRLHSPLGRSPWSSHTLVQVVPLWRGVSRLRLSLRPLAWPFLLGSASPVVKLRYLALLVRHLLPQLLDDGRLLRAQVLLLPLKETLACLFVPVNA